MESRGGVGEEPGPRLVGREHELAELERHLAAACAGGGRMVLLEGTAGIGKSSLLTALRPRAADCGARWLAARGSELERDFPFGVARQLLEPVVSSRDAEGLFAGAAQLARTALDAPDAAPSVDPGFAVLHGLFWLVANLAERQPIVLCVDDVQWADAPSLRFLDYLAVRLDGRSCALLVETELEAGAPEALIGACHEVTGGNPFLLRELAGELRRS